MIPEIEAEDYELLLGKTREDDDPIVLSLDDVKAMPEYTVVAYTACAGNKRRYLQDKYAPIKGLKWHVGAIANSKFRGVSMRYILLEKMGLKEEDLKGKHVVAYAYDADFQGKHFEVSVPCEHVLDASKEVTLVYESNGEALPKEHGFPIRMLTPGCIAVRSPKWVNRIFISDEEADHSS